MKHKDSGREEIDQTDDHNCQAEVDLVKKIPDLTETIPLTRDTETLEGDTKAAMKTEVDMDR